MHRGVWQVLAALAAAAYVVAGPAAAGSSETAARAPRAASARCDGAIRHPIEVSVVALDPVTAGGAVRIRLTAGAPSTALSRVQARVVHSGGARIAGDPRRALGRVERGATRAVDFLVEAPAAGQRRLIQFEVEGEGPNGPLRRGAVFNLLVGGGERPVRVVNDAAGTPVAEYAARRIAP